MRGVARRFRTFLRSLTEWKREPITLGIMEHIADIEADQVNLAPIVIRYANVYRDGNAGKWMALLTESSTSIHDYKWTEGMDASLQFAEDYNLKYYYHTLLWSKEDFFPTLAQGYDIRTRAAREPDNDTHISAIMNRYKGRLYRVDVWNEVLTSAGAIESTGGVETLTADELAHSFALAHSIDPTAKLGYNDFGMEDSVNKFNGAIQLISDIRDAGGHVDFLGFQFHVDLNDLPTYDEMVNKFRICRGNNIEPVVTELDIRTHGFVQAGNTFDQAEAAQAAFVKDLMRACRDGGCDEVNVWGVNHSGTWIHDRDGTDLTTERPLPFEDDFTPNAFARALWKFSR
jgi:endo-1,4-beta-xylanase